MNFCPNAPSGIAHANDIFATDAGKHFAAHANSNGHDLGNAYVRSRQA